MPKKINTTDLKKKIKRNAPWIITAASVGTSIAIYRHYDAKLLLEVPKDAHKYMIESQDRMIYATKFGAFALSALPDTAINN